MSFTIYNFEDNNDVSVLAQAGQFKVIQWDRDLSVSPDSAATAWFSAQMDVRRRQLVAELDGKTGVTLQAGAMQWTVGSVHANTGVKSAGDFMGKMFRGAVSQDSVIKPEYSGTGRLVCEPTWRHLLLVDLSSGAAPWCSTTGFSSRATAPSSTPCSAAQTFLARWRATRACST
jgi:hypothetical protein